MYFYVSFIRLLKSCFDACMVRIMIMITLRLTCCICSFLQSYGSMDSLEPSKLFAEKDRNSPESAIISAIDRTMKAHADKLLHVMEGVSARLTQLETRTRNLENLVDDVKVSVGNSHGKTDGKLRQLENIMLEVI